MTHAEPLYLCPVDRSAVERWRNECRIELISLPEPTDSEGSHE